LHSCLSFSRQVARVIYEIEFGNLNHENDFKNVRSIKSELSAVAVHRDGARSENLGWQVVMQHASAAATVF
jgi:hypothetical protein